MNEYVTCKQMKQLEEKAELNEKYLGTLLK